MIKKEKFKIFNIGKPIEIIIITRKILLFIKLLVMKYILKV